MPPPFPHPTLNRRRSNSGAAPTDVATATGTENRGADTPKTRSPGQRHPDYASRVLPPTAEYLLRPTTECVAKTARQ